MATTFVVYDSRSGHLLGAHDGARDEEEARAGVTAHPSVEKAHVAVIAVPSDTIERGKRYKVDLGTRSLVITTDEMAGSGAAGRSA